MGDSTIIPVHIFNETLPRVDKVYTTLLQNIWLLCQRDNQFYLSRCQISQIRFLEIFWTKQQIQTSVIVILTFQTQKTTGWEIQPFIYEMNCFISLEQVTLTVDSFGYCTLNNNNTSLNSWYWEECYFCFMKMFTVSFFPSHIPSLITG